MGRRSIRRDHALAMLAVANAAREAVRTRNIGTAGAEAWGVLRNAVGRLDAIEADLFRAPAGTTNESKEGA